MPLTDALRLRRQSLVAAFSDLGLDSFLVTALPNIRYLTGFTGSNAYLWLTSSEALLLTDPRYTIQARQQTTCRIHAVKGHILPQVIAKIQQTKIRRIGFEKSRISFLAYDFLREHLPPRSQLIPKIDLVETLRMIKSPEEVALIRNAVNTNSLAFLKTLPSVRPGVRESEIAAELEYQMRRAGADGPSFDTIVASGSRAALPHARPTRAPLSSNQLLLIDMGATQEGYTSDMTRTVFLGRPAPLWKRVYGAVLEAQMAAIETIREGIPAAQPDLAARRVLRSFSLDKAFIHSTGHGLGLEIHESPRIGRKEETILTAGMVVTVEPGVYLEGKGGVRTEDTVLVTRTGCEILTQTSKDLTII